MSAGRRTRAVTNDDVAVEDSTYTSGRRGIAGTVFVHKICAAAADGGRDLGPRIAHAVLPIPGKGGNDWRYSWIPVIGPIIGGILGATLYNILGFGS